MINRQTLSGHLVRVLTQLIFGAVEFPLALDVSLHRKRRAAAHDVNTHTSYIAHNVRATHSRLHGEISYTSCNYIYIYKVYNCAQQDEGHSDTYKTGIIMYADVYGLPVS